MKVLKEILSWIEYIAIAFIIAAVLNMFVFQITNVDGNSMFPTLHDGDIYVISKIGHTFKQEPKHGDIVVIDSRVQKKRTFKDNFVDIFKYNAITTLLGNHQNDQIFWVKRVIGLPGDEIELLSNGTVKRNGEVLDETYVNPAETPKYRDETIHVQDGYVFVMGDNRNHSSDSRVIGQVPVENVIGHVKFKLKSGK